MVNLTALKSEIVTDPKALGYAGKSDSLCADLMNARTQNGTKLGVTKDVFVNQVLAWNEVEALSAAKRDALAIMLQADNLDLSVGGNPITYLATLFGQATETFANYLALATPKISRAEELGFGTVSHTQVAEARRS